MAIPPVTHISSRHIDTVLSASQSVQTGMENLANFPSCAGRTIPWSKYMELIDKLHHTSFEASSNLALLLSAREERDTLQITYQAVKSELDVANRSCEEMRSKMESWPLEATNIHEREKEIWEAAKQAELQNIHRSYHGEVERLESEVEILKSANEVLRAEVEQVSQEWEEAFRVSVCDWTAAVQERDNFIKLSQSKVRDLRAQLRKSYRNARQAGGITRPFQKRKDFERQCAHSRSSGGTGILATESDQHFNNENEEQRARKTRSPSTAVSRSPRAAASDHRNNTLVQDYVSTPNDPRDSGPAPSSYSDPVSSFLKLASPLSQHNSDAVLWGRSFPQSSNGARLHLTDETSLIAADAVDSTVAHGTSIAFALQPSPASMYHRTGTLQTISSSVVSLEVSPATNNDVIPHELGKYRLSSGVSSVSGLVRSSGSLVSPRSFFPISPFSSSGFESPLISPAVRGLPEHIRTQAARRNLAGFSVRTSGVGLNGAEGVVEVKAATDNLDLD